MLLGDSDVMQDIHKTIHQLHNNDTASVLITGETGVGKELVARAIHFGGPRASKPFVAVNCGAITSTLWESAFFGHVRGAFTGATENHKGHFESADGGTLFLDEIGDMPIENQVKLLRVLDDGVVMRVGATQSKKGGYPDDSSHQCRALSENGCKIVSLRSLPPFDGYDNWDSAATRARGGYLPHC